ncbi:MAG: glycosyltransferase family 39 protein, partial [Tepidiformaceae bacterium]
MGIAAFLRLYRLADTGQNLYYAAGVRSMLDSWHNFFFVAFDPGGALAIDKPPLGFWLQAASAKALGFHWWTLALPQAVAGTVAAPVLYVIVRGRFGRTVAPIAALALALTPASVASARNNSLDTLTMLLMLVASAAALRALHDDRFRWLAITAVACGLAFNTKMFAAFVPLPAFAVAYTVAHRGTLGARRKALTGFGALLVAVSLSWVVVVGVTPASARPVLYNGYGNSIWALTFRFNGINRIIGTPPQSQPRSPIDTSEGQSAAAEPPSRTPWRLFVGSLGGQIGWLLLAAIAGGVWLLRRSRRAPEGILWATWFASALVVFTVSSDLKPQYLEAMAAPTAVCASVGLVALVDSARRHPIPAAIGAVVLCAYSSYLLLLSPESRWWTVVVIVAALVSAATIAISQALRR